MKKFAPGEEPLWYKVVVSALLFYGFILFAFLLQPLIEWEGWHHLLRSWWYYGPTFALWIGYMRHEFPDSFSWGSNKGSYR